MRLSLCTCRLALILCVSGATPVLAQELIELGRGPEPVGPENRVVIDETLGVLAGRVVELEDTTIVSGGAQHYILTLQPVAAVGSSGLCEIQQLSMWRVPGEAALEQRNSRFGRIWSFTSRFRVVGPVAGVPSGDVDAATARSCATISSSAGSFGISDDGSMPVYFVAGHHVQVLQEAIAQAQGGRPEFTLTCEEPTADCMGMLAGVSPAQLANILIPRRTPCPPPEPSFCASYELREEEPSVRLVVETITEPRQTPMFTVTTSTLDAEEIERVRAEAARFRPFIIRSVRLSFLPMH